MQTLTTERLRLRDWQDRDLQPFAELNADPDVMRYLMTVINRDESDALVQRCRDHIQEHGWGFWALEHKQAGHCIGFVGLNKPRWSLPCSPCVEIGWRLAKPYWRQGLATEAAKAVIQFGFEQINLDDIKASALVDNQASISVMEKLGMNNLNQNFDHPAMKGFDKPSECVLYQITRRQWLGNQTDRSSD